PVAGITKVVEQSIRYAESLTDNVYAIYVAFDEESAKQMKEKWDQFKPEVRLLIAHSQYRSIVKPVGRMIDFIRNGAKGKGYAITVLIPQFIPKRSWHNILHNQSSFFLRTYLLYSKNVTVTTVPYRFKK